MRYTRPTRHDKDRKTCYPLLCLLLTGATAAPATSVLSAASAAPSATTSTSQWGQWRGPLATGEAPTATPPLRWSETENVRWKVAIPGSGHASPIVWGEHVFVATAVPVGGPPGAGAETGGVSPVRLRFLLLALDRTTGKVLWERVAREGVPHEGIHNTSTFASASPVTDGEVVIASFGSNGIYAFDMNGTKLWETDLGDMSTRNEFGEGGSPALFGDTLVVLWDHEGDSFIVALSKSTGKELWRQSRDEPTSWSTPLVVEPAGAGKPQVIVNATNRVRSYDLATGTLLWSTGGMTTNVIPSPVYADDVVYVMSGFRGNALKAINLSKAAGDFSEGEALRWAADRDTPYVPSPLLYRGALYILKTNTAVLTTFDAISGAQHYGPERLEGLDSIYASPVAADGRVYVADRSGAVMVLAAGPKLEVLAVNKLDDGFDASPALVGDTIFLRGRKHLYRIASPKQPPSPKAAAR